MSSQMKRSRPRRLLRLALLVYALCLLAFVGLLGTLGRRGLIEHYTFAPHLIAPYCSFRSGSDASGVAFERRLPAAERVACGSAAEPANVVLFAESAEPVELVVFVCPGAAASGESHAAQLWMNIPTTGLFTASFDYPGVRQPGDGDALRRMLGTARAALACVRSRAPDTPLILVGTSLGAALALALAVDAGAVGLVLDTPADLAHEIARRGWLDALPPLFLGTTAFFAAGVPEDLEILGRIERLPADLPVLVGVADADPVVDPGRVRLLAERLGTRARVWEAVGNYHALVLTHAGFRNEMHDWIHEIVPGLVSLRHFGERVSKRRR